MTDRGYPDCEAIPEGCSTNGGYVSWRHPDDARKNTRSQKKCYKIGETGPCQTGHVISINGLEVECSPVKKMAAYIPPIVKTIFKHCWPGQPSCFSN